MRRGGMPMRRGGALLAALLAALLLPVLAQGGLSLSPTAFRIDPQRTNTAQVRFQNGAPEAMRFRVEVMEWRTENGAHVYRPTREVQVSPPEFELAPGEAQVIRVGLVRRAGEDELAYRVFVRQQRVANAGAGGQDAAVNVQRLVHISLPVYVTPSASAARLSAALVGAEGGARLRLDNSGNRHVTLRQARLVWEGGEHPLGSVAVLGSSTLLVPVPLAGGAGAELRYQDDELREVRVALAWR